VYRRHIITEGKGGGVDSGWWAFEQATMEADMAYEMSRKGKTVLMALHP
jgi:hypothetical protein